MHERVPVTEEILRQILTEIYPDDVINKLNFLETLSDVLLKENEEQFKAFEINADHVAFDLFLQSSVKVNDVSKHTPCLFRSIERKAFSSWSSFIKEVYEKEIRPKSSRELHIHQVVWRTINKTLLIPIIQYSIVTL